MTEAQEKEFQKIAQKLIVNWQRKLVTLQKKRDNYLEIFTLIFGALKINDVPREIVEEKIKEIARSLYPDAKTYKQFYQKAKRSNPDMKTVTENEYLEGWKNDIMDNLILAFLEDFPEPEEAGLPKKVGRMSYKEYRKQQEYADSFPTIDVDEVELATYSQEEFDKLEKELLAEIEKEGGNND